MNVLFWYWWAFAALLLVVEIFAPGFVFLWLAVSAFLTGALLWFLPGLGWQWQLLSFAGLGLVTVFGWLHIQRRFRRLRAGEGTAPLNRRGEQLLGREFPLVGAIEGGRGKVRVGDTVWPVTGPDLPAGSRVRVIGVEGTRLRVEEAGREPGSGGA